MDPEADPTIKNVTLTGLAADGYTTEGGGNRKSRKKGRHGKILQHHITKMEGAGATSPGTLVQLAATHVPGLPPTEVIGIGSKLTASAALIPVGGSSKPQHVILNKTKKKGLVLAAPKVAVPEKGGPKRRKTVKKIRLSVGGITRKLHKAKAIRAKADKQTFTEIKKELVTAGLIKEDSKAPETILRQMHSDFMVLKKRAL